MDQFEATTIEMNHDGYSDLANQLKDTKEYKDSKVSDIREKEEPTQKPTPSSKKYVFRKGEQSMELDDDFELEMTADKRPIRLTLRELKDRAAGDIAIKNRMHSLAEEKKRVQSTFREFAQMAKNDPLAALEFISSKAKEADSEFEYNNYIEKLAEQAEKLGQMDDKDRKAWELEKKLSKAEENLLRKERTEAVVLRKQEMLSTYPEIGDSEFGEIVDTVLNNDELMEGLETEDDVLNRTEDLIQEILTQRDLITVIREVDPAYTHDNQLIYALSDQLRANPDLDEEDVRDIVRAILAPQEKRKVPQISERSRDIKTLSNKQRQSMPVESMRQQNLTPYQLLQEQLIEKREEIRKTPLYKR